MTGERDTTATGSERGPEGDPVQGEGGGEWPSKDSPPAPSDAGVTEPA